MQTLNTIRKIILFPFKIVVLIISAPIVLLMTDLTSNKQIGYAKKFLSDIWNG